MWKGKGVESLLWASRGVLGSLLGFESQPPDVNESEADQQGRPGVSASVWTLGHFSMARGSVY